MTRIRVLLDMRQRDFIQDGNVARLGVEQRDCIFNKRVVFVVLANE